MKPTAYDELKGVDKFEAALEYFSKPENPLKVIKELKKARDEANAAIKELNMKGEAASLLASAKEKNKVAEAQLQEATTRAKAIADDAEDEAADLRKALKEKEESLHKKTKERADALNKKAAELNAREKSLQDYANILDEQATENRKLNAEAQFVKEKYETLLSEFDKLRATA